MGEKSLEQNVITTPELVYTDLIIALCAAPVAIAFTLGVSIFSVGGM